MSNVHTSVHMALTKLRYQRENTPDGDSSSGDYHTGRGNELPGDTDVEARVAKLESHFEYIRRDLDSVATDVKELRNEMRDEFKVVRSEMRDGFKAVRSEMHEEFKAVRSEMHEEFRVVRSEIQSDSKTIRSEMHADSRALRNDMREDFRILYGSLIAVALGIAGLMAKGFGWL